jgi:hypothetical protein
MASLGRDSRQELRGRNQSRDHEGMLLTSLLPPPPSPRLDKLFFLDHLTRDGTANSGLGSYTPVTIKKMPCWHASSPICQRQLLSWEFFFPVSGDRHPNLLLESGGLHSFPLDNTWVQECRTFIFDTQNPTWVSEEDVCWGGAVAPRWYNAGVSDPCRRHSNLDSSSLFKFTIHACPGCLLGWWHELQTTVRF